MPERPTVDDFDSAVCTVQAIFFWCQGRQIFATVIFCQTAPAPQFCNCWIISPSDFPMLKIRLFIDIQTENEKLRADNITIGSHLPSAWPKPFEQGRLKPSRNINWMWGTSVRSFESVMQSLIMGQFKRTTTSTWTAFDGDAHILLRIYGIGLERMPAILW